MAASLPLAVGGFVILGSFLILRIATNFTDVSIFAINVITMLGLQFGWLLGGTVLVEVVFSWPGIGNYMYNALQTFDFPAIMAVTVIITIGFVLVNLVVDLLYPIVDPRIRALA